MYVYALDKTIVTPPPPDELLGATLTITATVSVELPEVSSSSSAEEQQSSSSSVASLLPSADDANIFLMRYFDGETSFMGVCSTLDMIKWPEDAPGDDGFYRVSEIELDFRDELLAEQAYLEIENDVQELQTAFDAVSALIPEETVTYDFSVTNLEEPEGTRYFTMKKYELTTNELTTRYRLHAECIDATICKGIFLYRDDEVTSTSIVETRPIALCSMEDMGEYGMIRCNDIFPPFYRGTEFAIESKNAALLLEAWNNLKVDGNMLRTKLFYKFGGRNEVEGV